MTAHLDKTIEQFRTGKAFVQTLTISGTGTHYLALRPSHNSTIMINKAASTAVMKVTNGFTKTNGVVGAVDNEIFGENQSEAADDYHKGHTAGLTGIEIDCSAYVADIEVVVTQFRLGD